MTDDDDRATADALVNKETRGYRPTKNYLDQYQYPVHYLGVSDDSFSNLNFESRREDRNSVIIFRDVT